MIVVTGATGQLGRLVVSSLLGSVSAERVVAAVRTPSKAADLGVVVREADYDRPETLTKAFDGATSLLLISANEMGKRFAQHKAVVDAAKAAGVSRIVYTSILHADVSPIVLAAEHKATEEYIAASGLTYTFLRNGWYTENYEAVIKQGAANGAIYGAARDGRIAAAPRADYAAAAARALVEDGHDNKIYELSGDEAFTMSELAQVIGEVAGTHVEYLDLPEDQYLKALLDAGLPEPVAGMLSSTDVRIAEGHLADTPGDLSHLIGRPTTPLLDSVKCILS